MRTIILLTLFFCSTAKTTVAQSSFKRKTDWTVAEVREWVDKNKNYSTWHGLLLYQGSDTLKHHFISRLNDSFVWFNIDKASINLVDEQKYMTISSAPLGYYYVDGTKGFLKVKEYR